MSVGPIRSVGVAMRQFIFCCVPDRNDFYAEKKCLARKGMIPVDFDMVVFDFHDLESVVMFAAGVRFELHSRLDLGIGWKLLALDF